MTAPVRDSDLALRAIPLGETGARRQADAQSSDLDRTVARSIPFVSFSLSAFHVVFALSCVLWVPQPQAGLASALAGGLAAIFLSVSLTLRRWRLAERWAQPVAAGLALLVLGNCITLFALIRHPAITTYFLLFVITVSLWILSRLWLGLCLGATLGARSVLAWRAPPSEEVTQFGFGLAIAVVIGVLAHETRLRTTGHLGRLRELAEQRGRQLAGALAAADGELEARRAAEAALRAREGRLTRFNRVLLQLAKNRTIASGDFEKAVREITQTAAHILSIERVSVWFYDDRRTKIVCQDLYILSSEQHSRGEELRAADYPRYFAALEENRAIPAHDARHDPRTREFTTGYLEPLGITSMLDAPIRFRGDTLGVVCHENVGSPRVWASDEEAFAGSIADFVAIALEERDRLRSEEDRRQLERRMQESQKLESLGVLAGGIAHDFNNLLATILGNAELAQCDLPPDSSARRSLEELCLAGQRAAGLTNQMLAYSGRAPFRMERVDLSRLVRETIDLLRTSIRRNAHLCCELASGLPPVEADSTQIRQVVMNLITNASDALGERGGRIEVRTETVQIGEPSPDPSVGGDSLDPGLYVSLEVRDEGCGMDAATRERIFEPFFTTKFAGRGLGLAATLGIVRSHRGTITVRTSPGRGTRFRLLLPCASQTDRDEDQDEEARASWQGEGSVLLVDDEEGVRHVTGRMLERAGFRVLSAENGEQAIALLSRHGTAIVLALVDLTMPDRDGWEVARALRAQKPGLPVILMSGYDESDATCSRDGAVSAGFLHKPFTRSALLETTRAALESAVESGT